MRTEKPVHHKRQLPLPANHNLLDSINSFAMSLTSLELNYLIWRYLQESGFELAAYSLQKDSHCLEYEHYKNKFIDTIEPGCLVNMVQKGILYTFVEDVADGKEDRISLVNAIVKDKQERQIQNQDSRFLLKADANGEAPETAEVKEVEMQDAEEAQQEEDDDVEFTTAKIEPVLNFSSSLVAQWHPTSDVFAYGKGDSTAIIHALDHNAIAETVTLNHPPILGETPLPNEISTVSWSPQGTMVLTSGVNGEIRAWTPDGRLKNIVNSGTDAEKTPATLHSLEWSPRGLYVLSIDAHNTLCVWDGTSLTLLQEIRTPEGWAHCIDACWVSDLKFAVSTSKNLIKIYGVTLNVFAEVAPVGHLAGHEHPICMIKYNPVSKLLASASDVDHAIKVWNSLSPQDALELNVASEKDTLVHYHTAPIVGLHWVSLGVQGNELVSVSMEGTVNLWDAFTGDALVSTNIFKNPDSYQFGEDVEIESKNPLVFATALSPDSRFLAIGDAAGNVSIWDVRKGKMMRCLGMYAFEKGDKTDVGICDLVWDSTCHHICVCYKGADSVVLEWK